MRSRVQQPLLPMVPCSQLNIVGMHAPQPACRDIQALAAGGQNGSTAQRQLNAA